MMNVTTKLLALLAAIAIWGVILPAWADWSTPLSFSNADLTQQDFSGQSLQAAELSNANLELTDFSNADLRGAVLSASVLTKTNLHGADLTNAMADQSKFFDTDLSDAVLVESILLGSTFEQVDITGADFSDAILDRLQVKDFCAYASGTNPTTGIKTRDSLGCR
ncbi:MAG: pentapeptide repeat-containing protein [Elainellaceae cyanobacterium]